MDYDRIILELLDRIKRLEEDVAVLKGEKAEKTDAEEIALGIPSPSKKYQSLKDYLLQSGSDEIHVTFTEIEHILGFSLPSSARAHRAFWANTTTHSIALSWMSCEYETVEVDMRKETVVFRKKPGTRIDDLMSALVADLIHQFGLGYPISAQEIRQQMKERYGTNPGSVLPADYCYNRVNKGIDYRTKPALFEFDAATGQYKCLGIYPYNGDVFYRPRGESHDIRVGTCEHGKRKIDGKNFLKDDEI